MSVVDDNRTGAAQAPECFLFASAGASAQSFALLAVPVHTEARDVKAEILPDGAAGGGDDGNDKPADPIEETDSLAAVDLMLRGGILGDW